MASYYIDHTFDILLPFRHQVCPDIGEQCACDAAGSDAAGKDIQGIGNDLDGYILFAQHFHNMVDLLFFVLIHGNHHQFDTALIDHLTHILIRTKLRQIFPDTIGLLPCSQKSFIMEACIGKALTGFLEYFRSY